MKNKILAPAVLVAVLAGGGYYLFLSPAAKERVLQKDMDKYEILVGQYINDMDRCPESFTQGLDRVYQQRADLHPDNPEFALELVKTACYLKNFELAKERAEDMEDKWPTDDLTKEAPLVIAQYKDYWSKEPERKKRREEAQRRAEERRQQNQQNGGGQNGRGGSGQGQGGGDRGQGGPGAGRGGNGEGQPSGREQSSGTAPSGGAAPSINTDAKAPAGGAPSKAPTDPKKSPDTKSGGN